MKENKMSMIVSAIIVVAVIAVLVFITIDSINKKIEPTTGNEVGKIEQKDMETQTQGEEGIKITILKEGTGAVAKSGDMVAMNYTGKLADGTVFDSNVDPKFSHVEPFIFTIDGGEVIKGWDVGVAGMKEGERRMLELAPEYAYGATGAGGVIPPNATLVFEVELLQIKK